MLLAAATTSAATAAARSTQPRRSPAAARHCAARHWGRAAAAAAAVCRQQRCVAAAEPINAAEPAGEAPVEGLLPEEDAQVPGGYREAMSSKTPLGKAVSGACEELDTLGSLERQTLEEAEGLLKQLGFKGSLFAAPAQPPQEGGQEGAPPSQ